ncbi:hypothetical protein GCM10009547_49460 [Sporichthya brevicatena]|uniref:Uncharacterized protein n=1 Tax=Sporichthya brevicatena TaxID=171442 RepID=A0ABN1HEC1_9ACTN
MSTPTTATPTGGAGAEATEAEPRHYYLSTACRHEVHGQCRRTCAFCDAACVCFCHYQEVRS